METEHMSENAPYNRSPKFIEGEYGIKEMESGIQLP